MPSPPRPVPAFAALVALFVAAPAHGAPPRTRVALSGFVAPRRHEGFAQDLTGTVRWAAGRARRWRVARAEVDLDEAMQQHGCAVPDELCLGKIATALDVDALVVGRVTRTRGRRWSVGLVYFDRRQLRVTASAVDTFAVSGSDVDDLRPRAVSWVDTLTGGR